MSRFNLEEALAGRAPIFGNVPESGTREQIEYIDLALIDSDPNNFYELSGIDALKRGPGLSHLGGSNRLLRYDSMPQHFTIRIGDDPEIKRSWAEVYDALAVVALERAAESEATCETESDGYEFWPDSTHEDPPESGLYWCITGPLAGGGKLCWWNAEESCWEHPGAKFKLTHAVISWMKCPELPEWLSWKREGEDV